MEQPCHGRSTTEIFEGCHDLVTEYVEKLCSSNGGLRLYSKDQSLYHNLFPLSSSFLILTKHDYGKQMIEKYEGCHVFYGPLAEYMGRIFSQNDWLCVCNKDQVFYHSLLPLCSYILISIKYDDIVCLWDHLLDWIHSKSEFT